MTNTLSTARATPSVPNVAHDRVTDQWIAAAMELEAASLVVMSALHLSGIVAGDAKAFPATQAGSAEAVIGVVLFAGAVALRRGALTAPRLCVGVAIFGFVIGLSFTLPSGAAVDIAYHATVLPLLLATLVALLRHPSRTEPPPPNI